MKISLLAFTDRNEIDRVKESEEYGEEVEIPDSLGQQWRSLRAALQEVEAEVRTYAPIRLPVSEAWDI